MSEEVRKPRSRGGVRAEEGAGGGLRSRGGQLPELLDVGEVAQRLATSERHVRRLVDEKRIPYLKIGHFVRFDPEEVARWMDRCRVAVFDPRAVSHRRWYDGRD